MLTAIDEGLGSGVFRELKLIHLVPQSRTTEEYLLKLAENMSCSGALLHSLRTYQYPQPSFVRRVFELARLVCMDARSRRFELARRRGVKKAKVTLADAA